MGWLWEIHHLDDVASRDLDDPLVASRCHTRILVIILKEPGYRYLHICSPKSWFSGRDWSNGSVTNICAVSNFLAEFRNFRFLEEIMKSYIKMVCSTFLKEILKEPGYRQLHIWSPESWFEFLDFVLMQPSRIAKIRVRNALTTIGSSRFCDGPQNIFF